ncbi:hypothetical protein OG413_46835 [Streptomyces sp. NBC_01433]|uniref:hypothetical protein n=1 Tax=Streptomyces sp. NBC_01433 TaxID=2903864 RepID=UPI00225C279D|nr:hypothetical protein [Streptomyces sp. NBC_01433]MCX4682665.1 hypothetical protein [Streptomyces sp. NBC_01433]MCX4682705.1 hypothetical protein [Streptomyces sp. NBC_01433]
MSLLRIMDSDPDKARRTAAAVQRAPEASPEVVVGNISESPNHRDGGLRVFMEVLFLEAPAAPRNDYQEVTVERADRPQPRTSRRALARGGRRKAGE